MLANMQALQAAAHNLGKKIEVIDRYGDVVRIEGEIYVHSRLPFNTESVSYMARDKAYTHYLLEGVVRMPRMRDYFNPNSISKWQEYREYASQTEIVNDIIKKFSFPVIIKPNHGSFGEGVVVANTKESVEAAVADIFDSNSSNHDYVLLAEEYLPPVREWRLLWLDGDIVLVYEKKFQAGRLNQNISPLHYEGAKAEIETDEKLIKLLTDFVLPIKEKIKLRWAGLDVALLGDESLVLYEINSHPRLDIFARDNGIETLIPLYERVLQIKNE